MTIEEVAELDRIERERLHAKAIADVKRAIGLRRGLRAPTNALERQLANLEGGQQ